MCGGLRVGGLWGLMGRRMGGKLGGLMTIRGREGVERVGMREVTGLINGLGGWVSKKGGERKVAVCLSNSVELMVCVFGELAFFLAHIYLYKAPRER